MQVVTLPFADITITIYNKHSYKDAMNRTQTRYVRRVLNNCFWGKSEGVAQIGTTTLGSDDYQLQIPEDTQYLDYYDWAKLPNDIMPDYFTLNTGDIIVKGAVEDEISDTFTTKDLLEKYANNSMTIKYAYNNAGSGKPLGHYKGVGK